jgi:hypothetical protein
MRFDHDDDYVPPLTAVASIVLFFSGFGIDRKSTAGLKGDLEWAW